jgi:hypothetical protein
MMPLISVDVVIGFLLEVERLLWLVVSIKGPLVESISHQADRFTKRFASLLINLRAIEFFGEITAPSRFFLGTYGGFIFSERLVLINDP